MDSAKEFTLIELLNMILKESSVYIASIKELSDESKAAKILNIM